MKIVTLVLLLIALVHARGPARAEERTSWRLGEPEVVWRYEPTSTASFPAAIATIVLHPDGGFVVVTWTGLTAFTVHRFSAGWRALWSTDIAVPGRGPNYFQQFAHVAVLSTGHVALSLTQALVMIEPTGRLAWIRGAGRNFTEHFAGFSGLGPVIPAQGGVLVGGYGDSASSRDPACWGMVGKIARVSLAGHVVWRAAYGVPWRPGQARDTGFPIAAVPLVARADGGAFAYADVDQLGTDLFTITGLTRWSMGTGCRMRSIRRVLEVDPRGRIQAHATTRAALATQSRRDRDLPRYILIDSPLTTEPWWSLTDPVLVWFGPEAATVYHRAEEVALGVPHRYPEELTPAASGIATVAAVAAATMDDTTLVLLSRRRDARGEFERSAPPFKYFLMVVSPRGVTLVHDRMMPGLRSVRLMPRQGIAHGLVENTVVRFALRAPAP